MEGARDMGQHDASVVGEYVGENGGESGECIGGADSDAGYSAIGEDENGGDGVDVLLNLSCNILLVELVLLSTASVSRPGRVEDANLGRRLCLVIKSTGAYHYAVVAPQLVKKC